MSAKHLLPGVTLASMLLTCQLALADNDAQAIYRLHCAKCHGDDGRSDTWRGWLYRAEDLSDSAWQEAQSDADILRAIDDGPGAMPAYRERLGEMQRAALLQAVRALKQR